MSLLRVKTTECRIGIVGQYNAGKTVLLTSLVNHLEHHDPDRFRLGFESAQVRKFTLLPSDAGWATFNYAGFRDALVHQGRWPDKTRDCSQIVCQFERSDWTFSDALVKLYDLPGERLADAGMMGRSYTEWSDQVLRLIENDTPYQQACEAFLALLHTDHSSEEALLQAYKLSLARLILGFKPLISPSSFLLDAQGKLARGNTPEEIAQGRHCGLDAMQEFFPLPASLRTKFPDLSQKFSDRYQAYLDKLVVPFLTGLRSCHALIVLVDITTLLSAGVGMYDDNRQMLQELFRVLDPGENVAQALGRHLAKFFLPHQLRPGWINRVAFVAPKLDLIHPVDRDRAALLLKRFVGKLAENRDGLRAEFFNCAAVVSTKQLPGAEAERGLIGVLYRDSTGKKIPPGSEQRFRVSALPDDWPLNWSPLTFQFPEVYPQIPARQDCPPDQLNLDKLLTFVMD